MEVDKGKGGQIYGEEGDLTLGHEYTMQQIDAVLLNYILETYIIYLPMSPPMNLIKNEIK